MLLAYTSNKFVFNLYNIYVSLDSDNSVYSIANYL